MYTKPSFQDNIFHGIEVDSPEYETKVTCPKQTQYKIRNDSISIKKIQTKKNIFVIKRPVRGYLKLKLFCYFCEKYYRLKIHSEQKTKRKRTLRLTRYGIIGVLVLLLKNQTIQYLIWIYLLIRILSNLKDNFVEASSRHRAHIIRKWKPTEITHNY